MNRTQSAVIGVFENETRARQVVDELIRSGFSRNDVHLSSESDYTGEIASGGAALSGRSPEHHHHAGGFMGWLKSAFGADEDSDYHTDRYSDAVQRGRCVVAVDADDNTRDRAVDIMNSNGAIDIDEEGRTDTRNRSQNYSGNIDNRSQEGSIPVVREELQVGKRAIQRGGVRIFSRVVEEPVEETVRLREERVRVDRQPVDRPITDADRNLMREQTVEVTEMAEEPVVRKEARVVEEIRVGKDVTERTETIRDTVRHTEVETENIGGSSRGRADYDRTNYQDEFRTDFDSRYASSGARYETYAPAYDYGYRMASDQRYRGRNWDDVESTLRTDYLRNNPNSSWDNIKGAVRYGWEKVTRKR